MANKDFNIIITGTGFSGVCVAIQLKKIGFHNFKIIEKYVLWLRIVLSV